VSSRQSSKKKKKKDHRQAQHRGYSYKRDEHHVYPHSRKKDGDLGKFKQLLHSLRLKVIIKKHNAWHHLFFNLFGEEIIFLIKTAFKNGRTSAPDIIYFIKQASRGSRTAAEATKKDLAAWKEVFNGYNSWRKIKKEIQKEWMYPGIKAIILQHKIVGVIVVLKNISKKSRVIDDIYRCKNAKVISLKNNQLLKIT